MILSKSYSELILLPTFEERFEYLKQSALIGQETFGSERYLNQILYGSKEWKRFRNEIIIRDSVKDKICDLGVNDGYHYINGLAIVHHINPITIDDILERRPCIFDPNNVITCWEITHKAIHYGDINLLPKPFIERTANDTCPWRR